MNKSTEGGKIKIISPREGGPSQTPKFLLPSVLPTSPWLLHNRYPLHFVIAKDGGGSRRGKTSAFEMGSPALVTCLFTKRSGAFLYRSAETVHPVDQRIMVNIFSYISNHLLGQRTVFPHLCQNTFLQLFHRHFPIGLV